MLKSLKLSHFRQHIDRAFEFGPGVNAIRGEVEAGKTTITEAFVYFLFGSGALRESLDDVVTYHHPVSKLRVDAVIEHLGVTYSGYRGKSGAEVSFAGEKVTGQREVTKFFEKLLGTTADMAGKLMFASQKGLAESLKAGPTAAGKMIEDLANFDLIDRVAESIAARRPTGNTAAVESRIATLSAQLTDAPAEDLAPLRAELTDAEADVTAAEQQLQALRTTRAELDVERAIEIERQALQLDAAVKTSNSQIAEIDRALRADAVQGPTEKDLAVARADVEEAKLYAKASTLHGQLTSTDTSELWDKDLAALEAEIVGVQMQIVAVDEGRQQAEMAITDLQRQMADVRRTGEVRVAQLEGRLIKESTCALCQKDLADVPEVVRTNSDLNAQIIEAKDGTKAALDDLSTKLRLKERVRDAEILLAAGHQEYLKDLQAVVAANARVEQLYARAADFILVDRSVVPGRWSWCGMDVTGERPDAIGALAKLEQQHRAALADAAMRAEKGAQRGRLVQRRDSDVVARAALPLADAKETLDFGARYDQQIRDVAALLWSHQSVVQRLQGDLATKVALAEQSARALAQTRTQLEAAQAELAAMQKYNLLVKKVRAARPVITNKLWNIVLAGVSKHFTDVRGTPSNITRADGMFKCNGFPVSGLSGSAEDMLGLSMRIALTRTFLPGADFLQLDEPAAACSDAREQRMLGVLSTLGFGQTIIVSHSDLTDAVADRIINV